MQTNILHVPHDDRFISVNAVMLKVGLLVYGTLDPHVSDKVSSEPILLNLTTHMGDKIDVL